MLGFILSHLPIVQTVSGSGANTIDGLLDDGTSLVTWLITTMTSFVTFIAGQPLILIFLIMLIVSFAVGLIFRIMRSTGIGS